MIDLNWFVIPQFARSFSRLETHSYSTVLVGRQCKDVHHLHYHTCRGGGVSFYTEGWMSSHSLLASHIYNFSIVILVYNFSIVILVYNFSIVILVYNFSIVILVNNFSIVILVC